MNPIKYHLLLLTLLTTVSTHAATRFWDGGGTAGFWDISANWSNNAAPINGDALVFPANVTRLVNTNRASGGLTNLSSLRFIGGGYEVFSGPLILTNGLTNVGGFAGGDVTLNAVLQPRSNQSWSVGTVAGLTLNSNVLFPSTPLTLTVDVGSRGVFRLNESLRGHAQIDVVKLGGGTLDLNGNTNVLGALRAGDGILNIDGFINGSLIIS